MTIQQVFGFSSVFPQPAGGEARGLLGLHLGWGVLFMLEQTTLGKLFAACRARADWRSCRQMVLELAPRVDDTVLFLLVQEIAGVFQQQEGVAFLALPPAQKDAMLAWLRELGGPSSSH